MTERLRGRAAVKQRKRRLKAEPLCRDCFAEGRIRISTVPDHIIPLAKGGSDLDSNIRCLCDECHATRTAEQFGHNPRAAPCDLRGRTTDSAHPWNRPRGGGQKS